jgi:glycerol 2-dehydrogenase (NADP+)
VNREEDHVDVVRGLETSLAKLNCEYIDMYLMHWPQSEVNGIAIPI